MLRFTWSLFLLPVLLVGGTANSQSNSLPIFKNGALVRYDSRGKAYKYANLALANKTTILKSRSGKAALPTKAIFRLNKRQERKVSKSSLRFLERHSGLFKIERPAETKIVHFKTTLSPNGHFSSYFRQFYQGVPVIGGGLLVGSNENKEIYHVAGHYLEKINIDSRPKISPSKAEAIAYKYIFSKNNFYESQLQENEKSQSSQFYQFISPSKLYVYNEGFLNPRENFSYTAPNNYKLVYVVTARLGDTAETILIHAQTGEVIKSVDANIHAEEPNIISDCSTGCGCPVTRNGIGSAPVGTNPIFGGTDVDKSYNYFNLIRDYYKSEFGRYGANNFGGLGNGLTFPKNSSYASTYYNGCSTTVCQSPYAWFSSNPPSVNFCANSLSGDVFGHEYFHAFNANFYIVELGNLTHVLSGQNESGAINEGLADMFGEDFDNYKLNSPIDWYLGTGLAIFPRRSYSYPEFYSYRIDANNEIHPYPNNYNSPDVYCGSEDQGGVHRNSTVISKAAFLAARGTTGYGLPLDRFNGCKIEGGIGLFKVIQILYHSIIRSSSAIDGFNEFYDAVNIGCALLINDARNIYHVTQADCDKMTAAMQAVEINQVGYCTNPAPHLATCDNVSCNLLSPFANI